MQCLFPFRVTKNLDREIYPDGLEVPCGKCLACRVKKRQEWAVRMLHELDSHDHSMFITLTYDDNHLPKDKSLRKRDIQLFLKRLRKNLEPTGKKIKYFISGEYGDETERPHYHGIIFGLSLQEIDKEYIKNSWPFCNWSIQSIAKKSFGIAESDSILYVSKYISKAITGEEAEKKYNQRNIESPFRLLSLGLGKEYVLKNLKQIIQQGYITVKGIKQSIPRYYIKTLQEKSPEALNILKDKIKQTAEINEAEKVELMTGLNTSEDAYYKTQSVEDVVEYYEKKKRQKKQYALNIQARLDLKEAKKLQIKV